MLHSQCRVRKYDESEWKNLYRHKGEYFFIYIWWGTGSEAHWENIRNDKWKESTEVTMGFIILLEPQQLTNQVHHVTCAVIAPRKAVNDCVSSKMVCLQRRGTRIRNQNIPPVLSFGIEKHHQHSSSCFIPIRYLFVQKKKKTQQSSKATQSSLLVACSFLVLSHHGRCWIRKRQKKNKQLKQNKKILLLPKSQQRGNIYPAPRDSFVQQKHWNDRFTCTRYIPAATFQPPIHTLFILCSLHEIWEWIHNQYSQKHAAEHPTNKIYLVICELVCFLVFILGVLHQIIGASSVKYSLKELLDFVHVNL